MTMATATDQVRQALEISGKPCQMEEVVALCPDLSWSQVFQALAHLSREGDVRLSLDGRRGFRASLVRSMV